MTNETKKVIVYKKSVCQTKKNRLLASATLLNCLLHLCVEHFWVKGLAINKEQQKRTSLAFKRQCKLNIAKRNKEVFYFEGICKGTIAENMHGGEGFGYDPIFIPEGASKSFAEMTMEEKNKFSHRQKAVTQLFRFLHSK